MDSSGQKGPVRERKHRAIALTQPSEAVPNHHMDYNPVSDELHREIIDLAISIAAQNRAKKAARRAARERAAEKRAGVAKRKAERLAKKELKIKVY